MKRNASIEKGHHAKMSTLVCSELKLLFKQRLTCFIIGVFLLFSLAGINSINNSNEMMLHEIKYTSTTIAYGSASYGSMLGILLFAILVVLHLSKDKRRRSIELIDTAVSFQRITAARIIAVLFAAAAAVYVDMLLLMVIQAAVFKIVPDSAVYLYDFTVITLLPIVFAVLISSGLYLIWHSVDMSLLITGVLFWFGMSGSHYLMLWSKPWAPVFSDFAGTSPIGRLYVYNRVLWFAVSCSFLFLGILFRRRYDFSLLASIRQNIKQVYMAVFAILMLTAVVVIVINEPYMSRKGVSADRSIQTEQSVQLQKLYSEVQLKTRSGQIEAKAAYTFDNSEQKQFVTFLVNEGLGVHDVKVNGLSASWERKDESSIRVDILAAKTAVVEINYQGSIKYDSPMGMAGYIDAESVYLLENANWLPRPLTAVKEKMTCSGVVAAPEALTVITPGKVIEVKKQGALKEWRYQLHTSSVSLGLFAGKYDKALLQTGSGQAEFYYSPKHAAYIEERKLEDYITKMINYYSETFGPYYSEEYALKIVETSIYKPGGHSSCNVVTVAEYMFNREQSGRPAMNDYVFIHDLEIIAHEIAHQWWGTGVEIAEEVPWSSEGLADYAAYKFIQNAFGNEQAYSISSLWEYAINDYDNSYYGVHPEEIKRLGSSYQEQMKMEKLKADLYNRMPRMLLEGETALGEERFLQQLAGIYKKYLFKTLTYQDFLKEMQLTKEDMRLE